MRTRFRVRLFDIVRCERCAIERAEPLPSEEALSKLYESEYFSGTGHGYRDYFGAEREVADQKARARMDALEAAGLTQGARVLEVGCADGRFLLEARRRAFDARGVEWSAEARAHADPTIRDRIVPTMAAVEGTFDAFAAFDVVEHWRHPLDELARARRRLREGALVAIVVPVIDNANARWAARSWDQYKPPEHLWFFSRQSLVAIVDSALDAELLSMSCAWARHARILDAWLHRRGPLARLEGACWRWLVRARLVARERLEDSVLLVARVRSRR
jgi:SAM-dependent methyltransferase